MTDPLTFLWPFVDSLDVTLPEPYLKSWPDQAFERLKHVGLLQPAEAASRIACPACPDGHVEEVFSVAAAGGQCRFSIPCPENMRVEIAAESLRQWSIGYDKIASSVAAAIAARGIVTAVVPNRVWRLGKVPWKGGKREALFARGLHLADAPELVHTIQRYGRPIVFVGDRLPPTAIWGKRVPAVIPLSHVTSLEDGALDLDPVGLISAVAEADEAAAFAESQAINMQRLNDLIVQKVHSVQRNQLTLDAMVEACRIHGGSRPAARALKKEGYEVHHSTIARAVNTAGGKKEITRQDSSDSVVRDVASQRRDGKKKSTKQAQDKKEE